MYTNTKPFSHEVTIKLSFQDGILVFGPSGVMGDLFQIRGADFKELKQQLIAHDMYDEKRFESAAKMFACHDSRLAVLGIIGINEKPEQSYVTYGEKGFLIVYRNKDGGVSGVWFGNKVDAYFDYEEFKTVVDSVEETKSKDYAIMVFNKEAESFCFEPICEALFEKAYELTDVKWFSGISWNTKPFDICVDYDNGDKRRYYYGEQLKELLAA
ncbi:hypothetical protein JTX96_000964 [Escherichia coli]|nr:hypothetical protein [Escherichia coli]